MATAKKAAKKTAPKKAAPKKKAPAKKAVYTMEKFMFELSERQWNIIKSADVPGSGLPPAFLSNILLLQILMELKALRNELASKPD